MILVLFSFIWALWLKKSAQNFHQKIHLQSYKEQLDIQGYTMSLCRFMKLSKIKQIDLRLEKYFIYLFPSIAVLLYLFVDISFLGILIIFIILTTLVYLSLLDYYYYLTDIDFILLIFILSLSYILLFDSDNIYISYTTFFMLLSFFSLFHFLCNLLKKPLLGLGDICLLISLSPLFTLSQMLYLLLSASVTGLGFVMIYYAKYKVKIKKLPFIPFISFSTFLLIFAKILPL